VSVNSSEESQVANKVKESVSIESGTESITEIINESVTEIINESVTEITTENTDDIDDSAPMLRIHDPTITEEARLSRLSNRMAAPTQSKLIFS
jgi:hypothetical protein